MDDRKMSTNLLSLAKKVPMCVPALLLALVISFVAAAPTKPEARPGAGGKLDDQLLDSLEDELLKGLTDGESDGQPKPATDSDDSAGDAEGAENEQPLGKIGSRMREAGERIATQKPQAETAAMQDEIVSDLEKLILELEKKCSGNCQGGKNSKEQNSERSDVKQPKQGSGKHSERASNKPARDSTTRLGKNAARPVDPEELRHLIRDVWGQLPQRAREQLLQSPPEEFLPKYEILIEQYYRRLAEDPEQK